MRQTKLERRPEKRLAREQSMTGWDEVVKGFNRQQMMASKGSQRWVSLGIGHHLARMMKGHI